MGRLSISFRDPKSARFLVGASSSSNATARYPPEPNFEAVTVVLLRGGTGVRLRARRMGAGLIPIMCQFLSFPSALTMDIIPTSILRLVVAEMGQVVI